MQKQKLFLKSEFDFVQLTVKISALQVGKSVHSNVLIIAYSFQKTKANYHGTVTVVGF